MTTPIDQIAARFCEDFPRLSELRAAVPDVSHPDAYFRNFDTNLENDHIRWWYAKLENVLRQLDSTAWADLKERAIPYLMERVEGRGWQPLFDTLNEAKAYAYLQRIGCVQIAFIKRSRSKTPDISAALDGRRVLCEVKTINVSAEEADRRTAVECGHIEAHSVATTVSDGLLQKIRLTIQHAIEQLEHEDPSASARRIVFTVLTFDDSIGDYQREYIKQIDLELLANPIVGSELVFCPVRNLFHHHRFSMESATVVEI